MQGSGHRRSFRANIKQVDYGADLQSVQKRDNRLGLKYNSISDEVKSLFISEVLKQSGTIKSAAEKFELNFSTAKAILHTYRKQGRMGRKMRRHNKNSCFIKKKKKIRPTIKIQALSRDKSDEKNNSDDSQRIQKIDLQEEIQEPLQIDIKVEFQNPVQPLQNKKEVQPDQNRHPVSLIQQNTQSLIDRMYIMQQLQQLSSQIQFNNQIQFKKQLTQCVQQPTHSPMFNHQQTMQYFIALNETMKQPFQQFQK